MTGVYASPSAHAYDLPAAVSPPVPANAAARDRAPGMPASAVVRSRPGRERGLKVRPSRVPAVSVPVGEPGSSWWHRDVGDVPQLAARPQDGLVKNVSAEMAGTASRGAAWGKDAPADGETALGSVPDDGLSRGRPLDSTVRAYMEPRFGRDFSQVRMHTGPAAQASAGAQGALAYTCGPHVIFGSGQYRPETLAGRWLIAHELTHVIQQQGRRPVAEPRRRWSARLPTPGYGWRWVAASGSPGNRQRHQYSSPSATTGSPRRWKPYREAVERDEGPWHPPRAVPDVSEHHEQPRRALRLPRRSRPR